MKNRNRRGQTGLAKTNSIDINYKLSSIYINNFHPLVTPGYKNLEIKTNNNNNSKEEGGK